VVSTPIRDVVRPYGELGLVSIANSAAEFVAAAEAALQQKTNGSWLSKVDAFLADMSWDETWSQMWHLITNTMKEKSKAKISTVTKQVGAGIAA
jgi:UDP-galactopyranose mutase